MADSSVIGASTVVSGHVRGEGSLEILGRVEGDVTVTGDVVVGASGRVRGSVSGTQLTIAGQVQGDLRGSDVVLVERGARVVGDIASPRIGIAPGALVRGHVQTDGETALPAASAGAAAAQRRPPIARVAPAPAPAPAPLLKAPHKAEPRKVEPMRAAPSPAPVPIDAPRAPATKVEPRRPPPPVVPVLGKGIKAKKKKGRE